MEIEESDCDCGHLWSEHKRARNGAFACSHYGCGCRDMVYPLHAAQPTDHCGPPAYQCEEVASSKLQELGTLLMQDHVIKIELQTIEIDDHQTGVGYAEASTIDPPAADLSSASGG